MGLKNNIEKINDYKIVLMPFPLAISNKLANEVKGYVGTGGILISEACPGRYSDLQMAN